MTRALQVWGGTAFFAGNQVRVIVSASTKKRAVELLALSSVSHITRGYFDSHFALTGNADELACAQWGEGALAYEDLGHLQTPLRRIYPWDPSAIEGP